MRLLFSVVATLLVAGFFASGCSRNSAKPAVLAAAPAALPPGWEKLSSNCREHLQSLPPEVKYRFFELPENHDEPDGRKIQVLAYGRFDSIQRPVVFFNGGPASSSHGNFKLFEKKREEHARSSSPKAQFALDAIENMVFIDQRGTGCSSAFPDVRERDANGVPRISHYGSRAIVLDAEVIRTEIFGAKKRWTVFGQSFGGLIAKRYLMVAPEGVNAIFAHGYSITSDPAEWILLRISAQARLVREYFAQDSEAAKRWQQFEAALKPGVCGNGGTFRVCGQHLLVGFLWLLHFESEIANISRIVKWLVRSDGTLDQKNLDEYTVWLGRRAGDGSGNALGDVMRAINWIDSNRNDPSFSPRFENYCEPVFQRLRARGEQPDEWPLHDCRSWGKTLPDNRAPEEIALDYQYAIDLTHAIPRDPLTLKGLRAAAERHPEIRIYIYAGTRDTAVPASSFREEVDFFGTRISYRSFHNSGHEGFYTEIDILYELGRSLPYPRP